MQTKNKKIKTQRCFLAKKKNYQESNHLALIKAKTRIAMKRKVMYRFNAETLKYEAIKVPNTKKILKYGVTAAAVVLYSWGVWNFVTPDHVKAYLAEKNQLKSKIAQTNQELDALSLELCGIRDRDNELYRSMLALGHIDENSWVGGTGGSIKNPEIAQLSDSKKLLEIAGKLQLLKHQLAVLSDSQDELLSKAQKEEKKLRSIPAIRPLLYLDRPLHLMSGFGMRLDPVSRSVTQMHQGIDMTAPTGTPIFATGDGVVARTEHKSNGYGLNVVIDHGYGYQTLYAHMIQIAATPGQKVKRGEVIGYVGSTGHSTAPHVHYEVFKNDQRIDPAPFIASMTVQEFQELARSVDQNVDFSARGRYRRK